MNKDDEKKWANLRSNLHKSVDEIFEFCSDVCKRNRWLEHRNSQLEFIMAPASNDKRTIEKVGVVRPVSAPECIASLLGSSEVFEVSSLGLASRPGVYFLFRLDRLVYVGQSISVVARLATHNVKFDRAMFIDVDKDELDTVEAAFITLLDPPDNAAKPKIPAQHVQAVLKKFGSR